MALTAPQYRAAAGWVDQLGDAASRTGGGLTIEAYRDTNSIAAFYAHNSSSKSLTVHLQFNHDRRPGEACHVHLHYTPMVAPSDVGGENCYFYYEYYWQGIGGTIPALASWTTGNATLHITAGDEFKHLTWEIVDPAAPTTESPSAILVFTLTRLGLDVNDTYDNNKTGGTAAANLCAWYLDAHYIRDRGGSQLEYSE